MLIEMTPNQLTQADLFLGRFGFSCFYLYEYVYINY
jgi:hypothetical protein